MTRDPKRTPDEAWDAVERAAIREEAGRVAKLSDAALDAELEKKNLDAVALRERGAALAAKLMAARQATASTPVAPLAPAKPEGDAAKVAPLPVRRRRAWSAWLAAAAVAALGGAVFMTTGVMGPASPGPASAPPDTRERAAVLREEGLAACRARSWAICLRKLDDAKALDPAGDGEARVVQARKEARDATGDP